MRNTNNDFSRSGFSFFLYRTIIVTKKPLVIRPWPVKIKVNSILRVKSILRHLIVRQRIRSYSSGYVVIESCRSRIGMEKGPRLRVREHFVEDIYIYRYTINKSIARKDCWTVFFIEFNRIAICSRSHVRRRVSQPFSRIGYSISGWLINMFFFFFFEHVSCIIP